MDNKTCKNINSQKFGREIWSVGQMDTRTDGHPADTRCVGGGRHVRVGASAKAFNALG